MGLKFFKPKKTPNPHHTYSDTGITILISLTWARPRTKYIEVFGERKKIRVLKHTWIIQDINTEEVGHYPNVTLKQALNEFLAGKPRGVILRMAIKNNKWYRKYFAPYVYIEPSVKKFCGKGSDCTNYIINKITDDE